MDRMIYVAMTGAREAMRAQALVAHNIANATTTGFRAVRHNVEAQAIEGPGFATRVNPQMVGIEQLEDAKEIALVKAMVQKHLDYTKSERAKAILKSIGLEPERLEMYFLSGGMGASFAEIARTMNARAVQLGPNPLRRRTPAPVPAGD